jgi:hypothetical protein
MSDENRGVYMVVTAITPSLCVSIVSVVISGFSFYFSRKFWFEANRPIVTVRVSTHISENVATTLSLVVENTGNRPAKNIKLSVDPQKLASALKKNLADKDRQAIELCFHRDTVIPILANGKFITNSFGKLVHPFDTSTYAAKFQTNSSESDWEEKARFDVFIQYESLDGRNFKDCIPLLIASDEGFAGSAWASTVSKPG